MIDRRLGKTRAVQTVEFDPTSEVTQVRLAEAMSKAGRASNRALMAKADAVQVALDADLAVGGKIDIGNVAARSTALIQNLVATGRIKIVNVGGETVTISGLIARLGI